MFQKILNVFRKKYISLNRLEISQQDLTENYKYLSSLNENLKVAPVIKSNAYGHGIALIAKVLDNVNAPFFCVDSLYEAYEIYKSNIKTAVLVMGYTNPQNLKVKKVPFKFAVYDLETAKVLNEYQKGCSVHIFIDTALNREGIKIFELTEFLNKLKKLKNIQIEGLMSHFASTLSDQDPLFKRQLDNFKKALNIFKEEGIALKWIHIGASGALINQKIRKEVAKISNLTRAGLILYGSALDPKLKPVAKLISTLSQIKEVNKGETVGYSGTFTSKKDMLIGILPVGYQDGVDRRLSNIGQVLIGGTSCKIVGKVSMNITAVDLSKVKNPKVGQEVVIYSNNLKDKNSIINCAKLCQTDPYEMLIHLNPSIRRIIV